MLQVYRHIYDNSVIYIGMGKLGRSKDKHNRSKEWLKLVADPDKLEVDILWETESRKEAYDKEQEFINLYGRKDINEGTLINKTNEGGWLQGVNWSPERIKKYSDNAKKRGTLKKWQKENGAAVKGKKLPKQKQQHINKRVQAIKKAWNSKTEEQRKAQTSLFINNNPSYKIQKCEYCGREIQGASAFKRFHGQNCKQNKIN